MVGLQLIERASKTYNLALYHCSSLTGRGQNEKGDETDPLIWRRNIYQNTARVRNRYFDLQSNYCKAWLSVCSV